MRMWAGKVGQQVNVVAANLTTCDPQEHTWKQEKIHLSKLFSDHQELTVTFMCIVAYTITHIHILSECNKCNFKSLKEWEYKFCQTLF